jgi:hypothetical protein
LILESPWPSARIPNKSQSGHNKQGCRHQDEKSRREQGVNGGNSGSQNYDPRDDLVESVKSMHVAGKGIEGSGSQMDTDSKDRASFGSNMTSEEESEESGLPHSCDPKNKTAMEHFHDHKFGVLQVKGAEK